MRVDIPLLRARRAMALVAGGSGGAQWLRMIEDHK
jgi:hypothetical protein